MIKLHQVSKSFNLGGIKAVDNISFSVEPGHFTVLLGGSGSGKTTTLKMINRLIERSSGDIFVNGIDVGSIDPVELRRGIGYVFQGIGLFPHLSVGANVAVTPQLLGWPKNRIDERVDELLDMVGLPTNEYRERRPRELSGGQRQRVGVARALAARPTLILMDEPFGALDPITRDALQIELKRLQRSLNLTVIMVTHDITEALLLADQIAVMNQGRLEQVGTPRELLTQPVSDYVAALTASPKRKAEQIDALLQRPMGEPSQVEMGSVGISRVALTDLSDQLRID
jgi:osmoprotectant transport system ATP-binding protein